MKISVTVLAIAVAFLCWAGTSLADLPQSSFIAPDPSAFLHGSSSPPNNSSSEIEPWFAVGVTNGDRSPDFVRRLRDASEKGNVTVQGFLGTLLVKGEGVPPDPGEGMRLLHSSAGNGCLPAMNELGYIYLEGHYGVPADPVEALKWIRPAAQSGWANAL